METKQVNKIMEQITTDESMGIIRNALINYEPKADYKKAYIILMDWFEYIPDEDKEEVSKQLIEIGL